MKKNYGPLLAAPGLLLMVGVLIIPIGFSIYCSVYKCDYLQFTEMVGLGNYIRALSDPSIRADFGRTFYISFVSLAISMGLGLALALWIHSTKNFLSYILQMIGLIPWVTSMTVAALLWKWLLDYDLGLVNYIFSLLGLQRQTILSNVHTAIYGVIFVISWRTVGYAMVIILAGLKTIPVELEQAAAVDGCGGFQLLRYIRLPMLKTQLLISSITLTMSNFNNLVVPDSLTGGGPGTASSVITITMYRQGVSYARFGYASAIALLILLINLIMVVVYVKAVRYDV